MFFYWPKNRMCSYQLIRGMVAAHFGGADAGEMFGAAARMDPDDLSTWRREWLALAEATAETAAQSEGILARGPWQRASTYYRLAGFFLDPHDPEELLLYRKQAETFRLGSPELEAVRIPFEGRNLYGYFARPATGQAPYRTLIVMGGLESMVEEVYFAVGAAALQAGFACLVLEGPGQGGTMREEGLYSRAEYDKPVSAAVSYLQGRTDVDPQRIGMIAYSLGGYYTCRAAAFEHRLRAAVAWGAEYDYGELWQSRPDNHPLAPRVLHTLGAHSMDEARRILKDFHLRGVAERIECPTLIVHGEEDFHVPLNHATRTYEALRCKKELKLFPSGKPGSYHCQWDVPHQVHHVMFEWLQGQLA